MRARTTSFIAVLILGMLAVPAGALPIEPPALEPPIRDVADPGSAASAAATTDDAHDEHDGHDADVVLPDGPRPDFDARQDGAHREPSEAQLAAAEQLTGVRLRWDLTTGLPETIMGRGAPITPASDAAPSELAMAWLTEHAAVFGLSPLDLTGFRVREAIPTEHNGATHVFVTQHDGDREVFGSVLTFVYDRDNRLVLVGGRYDVGVVGVGAALLDGAAALQAAAGLANVDVPSTLELLTTDGDGTERYSNVIARNVHEPMDATAKRVTFPMPAPQPDRIAWATVVEIDDDEWYEQVVDATTGELLYRRNLYASHARATVFPGEHPDESGPRTILPLTGVNGTWVTADTTVGNNVDAYEDRDENDSPDAGGRPVDPDAHFDYAWANAYQTSGGTDLETDADATVTQMFYYTNVMHHFLYGLGFTEQWRNFQQDNFGRPGAGNDPVNAEARDGWGTGTEKLCTDSGGNPILCRNNANFGTPGDGNRPRMQMYMWVPGNPYVDGAMDGDVIAHEYGHGLSNRLVGGGSMGGGLAVGSLGEGWSDIVSGMLWDDPVIGEYVTGNTATGIRGVSYDTSTLDFSDFSSGWGVHANGRIWATALWNVLEELRRVHGNGMGLQTFRQLVVDGMKNTPSTPTFLSARDGLLAADLANNGAANHCLIWVQFSERLMGPAATSTQTSKTTDASIPAECRPTADVGGPYVTVEGTDITVDASGSSAGTHHSTGPLSYAWRFGGTAFDDGTGSTNLFDDVGNDGTFPIAVRVTNRAGATAESSGVVQVSNIAPSVAHSNDGPQPEGSPLSVSGAITDPGWLDVLGATIDWGDGAVGALTGPSDNTRPDASLGFAAAHSYGDNGTYPVQVCGSDDDTTTCVTENATITNVAPSLAISPTQVTAIAEHGTVDLVASFTDPGWEDTHEARVDWGVGAGFVPATITDISTPTEARGVLSASHQYGDNGSYTVVVEVEDDDGGVDQASFTVDVGNVDPTATIDLSGATLIGGVPTIISNAGAPVAFDGTSTDPGSDDLALSWDWDDGTAPTTRTDLVAPPATDGPNSPEVSPRDVADSVEHTFGEACVYEIEFSSTDDDGGSAASLASVIITGNATRAMNDGKWRDEARHPGKSTALGEATMLCYLEIARFGSTVFDEVHPLMTLDDAVAVFEAKAPPSGNLRTHLDREILAAWLNFANGVYDWSAPIVDTNEDGTADLGFADAITTAEAVRLDPAATQAELEEQWDLLKRVNGYKP